QAALKQARGEVADRGTRAAKELGSGAGNAARELGATAEESVTTQIRKQTAAAKRRLLSRSGPGRMVVLAGAFAGAVTVYFFDPQQGRARRAQFIDWSGARLRRGWRAVDRIRARTGSNAAAFPQKMVSLRSGPRPADDLTLRDRSSDGRPRRRLCRRGDRLLFRPATGARAQGAIHRLVGCPASSWVAGRRSDPSANRFERRGLPAENGQPAIGPTPGRRPDAARPELGWSSSPAPLPAR